MTQLIDSTTADLDTIAGYPEATTQDQQEINEAQQALADIRTRLTPPPSTDFVTVQGTQFIKDGQPFRFCGTNAYWLAAWTTYGTTQPVLDLLDACVDVGITVIRTNGFNENINDPAVLQTAPGVYNESAWVAMDKVIAWAGERGLKLIIPLVNGQNAFGGREVYAQWAGCTPDEFYSDATAQIIYTNHIAAFLIRQNSINGIAYRDDPTIMAIECANEAHTAGGPPERIRDWYAEIISYIKSLDNNHLVATGEEGYDEAGYASPLYGSYSNDFALRANRGTSYTLNMQTVPGIDFGGCHLYPTYWGMNTQDGQMWIEDHARIAADITKLSIVGEYGQPDDRSAYLLWQTTVENVPACGGDMLWQFLPDSHGREWGADVMYPSEPTYISQLNAHAIALGTDVPVWQEPEAPPPVYGEDPIIVVDAGAMEAPWTDLSWDVVWRDDVDKVRVDQAAWGAFRPYYGQNINAQAYKELTFRVRAEGVSLTDFKVWLGTGAGPFESYAVGGVPTDGWLSVTIPMQDLNYSLQPFSLIGFRDEAGVAVSYYIDDVVLVPHTQNGGTDPNQEELQRIIGELNQIDTGWDLTTPTSKDISLSVAQDDIATLRTNL